MDRDSRSLEARTEAAARALNEHLAVGDYRVLWDDLGDEERKTWLRTMADALSAAGLPEALARIAELEAENAAVRLAPAPVEMPAPSGIPHVTPSGYPSPRKTFADRLGMLDLLND